MVLSNPLCNTSIHLLDKNTSDNQTEHKPFCHWVTVKACYQVLVVLTTVSPIFKLQLLKVPTTSVKIPQLYSSNTDNYNQVNHIKYNTQSDMNPGTYLLFFSVYK